MTLRITAPPGGKIKQYTSDPTALKQEQAWVLRTGTGAGIVQLSTEGVPMGLLAALTYATTESTTGVAYSYQFSYRTKEDTTERVTIT